LIHAIAAFAFFLAVSFVAITLLSHWCPPDAGPMHGRWWQVWNAWRKHPAQFESIRVPLTLIAVTWVILRLAGVL
jgi:hypothetical protein